MSPPGILGAALATGAFVMSSLAFAADTRLRIADVGNGLCVVVAIPGGHSMLYDAGDKGSYCLAAVTELISGSKIDLVVLSHSDSDHISELPDILGMAANADGPAVPAAKKAGTVIFPGDQHIDETKAIRRELAAIENARLNGATIWNLAADALPEPDSQQRRTFHFGDATATVIAGWSNGDQTRHSNEPPLPDPEHNNAISIVVRLEYGGHSVLLTGDTVGKLLTSKNSACMYAERIMRDRASEWPIKSDVLIGQHHGGNNASANCFIRKVMPQYVVFSSGHKNYRHPSQNAADRILATAQISPDAIFRTDLGDDEGSGEWIYKSIAGCKDQPGDDDIEVTLPDRQTEPVAVRYVHPHVGC